MTQDSIDYSAPPDAFVRAMDIRSLLPQRDPYVMVGRLLHFDMLATVTETTLTDADTMAEQGAVSVAALIENAAQTCSARIGYINRYILGREVAAGVLAAIDSLHVERMPLVGETITTTATVETELCGMMQVSVTTTCAAGTVMTARMKMVV